jgi:hypothetical protein
MSAHTRKLTIELTEAEKVLEAQVNFYSSPRTHNASAWEKTARLPRLVSNKKALPDSRSCASTV